MFLAPRPRNILPWPGPNPKKVNFMAPTRTDLIIFYPIRTGPKHFIINSKLPVFGLQQTCEYDQKWSWKNRSYSGKKYPDPDRTEIFIPDLTQPENIL